MTIYARSDISAVTLSSAHGGCGLTHSRPAPGGNPVKLWALSCPQCEDHLRSDRDWSPTIPDIPETPDEKSAREDWERRGAKDRDNVLALALAKLAGVELPESITGMIGGKLPHTAALEGLVVCPSGHENRAGGKFCGECGLSLSQDAVDRGRALPPSSPPEEPAPAAVVPSGDAARDDGDGLDDLPLADLKALAEKLGVATKRSKADQIAAIRAAAAS